MLRSLAVRAVRTALKARENYQRPTTQVAIAVAAIGFGIRALAAVVEHVVEDVAFAHNQLGARLQSTVDLQERVAKLERLAGEAGYPAPDDVDPLQRAGTALHDATETLPFNGFGASTVTGTNGGAAQLDAVPVD